VIKQLTRKPTLARKLMYTYLRILTILGLILLHGCSLKPREPGTNSKTTLVNRDLVCSNRVNIQPVSMNGAKAPKKAWDKSLARFKKYVRGNVIVFDPIKLDAPIDTDQFVYNYHRGRRTQLPISTARRFSEQLRNFPKGRNSILMFFVPDFKSLGRYYGYNGKYHIIAYSENNINVVPNSANNQAWQIVLLHELGHALGLPAARSHKLRGHCTHRQCVMYPKPDLFAVISVLFSGMPYDFCPVGKAELETAKAQCSKIEYH